MATRRLAGRLAACIRHAFDAPGELILACVATGWAVCLWWPGPSFVPESGFAAVEALVRGEGVLATIVTVLGVAGWAGLLLDGWPPRARAASAFAAFAWWSTATLEAGISRPQSPAWITACGIAWLGFFTWRGLTRQVARSIARQDP